MSTKSLSRKDTPFVSSGGGGATAKAAAGAAAAPKPRIPVTVRRHTSSGNSTNTSVTSAGCRAGSFRVVNVDEAPALPRTTQHKQQRGGITTAMQGAGFYNANSSRQADAVRAGLDAFRRAAGELPKPLVVGQNLSLAEYGSSQGGNSVAPFSAALAVLGDQYRSVTVTHTDLLGNDWNALVGVLHPSQPTSYAAAAATAQTQNHPPVFVSARAGSFHTRLFPDASVHLAWSSIANHWLSHLPASAAASNHLSETFLPDLSTNPELQAQAHKDWVTYLTHRRHELVVGGQLVNVELVRDAQYPNSQGEDSYLRAVSRLLHETFGKDEVFVFPMVVRTREDLLRPFEEGGDVAGLLEVREAQVHHLEDGFVAQFQRTGDVHQYAANLVGSFRAVATSLNLEERFGKDRTEAFYRDLTALVERSGTDLKFWGCLTVCVLRVVRVA